MTGANGAGAMLPGGQAPPCPTTARVEHDHGFGQGHANRAEGQVRLVAAITLSAMVAEIAAGWWTGSMSLLADGLHMGGHAVALGLAASAYWLARCYAQDRRLSFGSGKILDLSAYTSALLLGISALWLIPESIGRLLHPQPLQPMEALLVAVFGLLVNLGSAWLLNTHESAHADPQHGHGHHGYGHSQGHVHDHGGHARHHHEPHHEHPHSAHHDSNLQAALMHVIADALTSVAAILGLLAAWLWGWRWLDPLIALLAAGLVLRWALILIRQSGAVLLDAQAPAELREQVMQRLTSVAHSRGTDLHLWSVGQDRWTLVASVVSHEQVVPERYKQALASLEHLHHPIIEIHACQICEASEGDRDD